MQTEQSEAARLHTFHCTGCSEYGGAHGRQQDPAGPSGAARGVRLPAASITHKDLVAMDRTQFERLMREHKCDDCSGAG